MIRQLKYFGNTATLTILFIIIKGCISSDKGVQPKMDTVNYVDLERFMGDWYVIANIPTILEKRATNATESYKLDKDGSIKTTFTYYKDSPEGEKVVTNPRGFVVDTTTNAEWRMRFFRLLNFPFYIIHLDEDYTNTVIGMPSRKYVWIMSRLPYMEETTYSSILLELAKIGYDTSLIQRVMQDWDED